jgi:hypothetical protein
MEETKKLIEDENGNLMLQFSDEELKSLGWKIGDDLIIEELENGTISIKKL